MKDKLHNDVKELMMYAARSGQASLLSTLIATFSADGEGRAVTIAALGQLWPELDDEQRADVIEEIGHLIDHETGGLKR